VKPSAMNDWHCAGTGLGYGTASPEIATC